MMSREGITSQKAQIFNIKTGIVGIGIGFAIGFGIDAFSPIRSISDDPDSDGAV